MVAVLTAALMTAAEISSLGSMLGVVICLICMVVFILRVNGEDFFGTSVVHVAQPPVAQVSYQKVAVPFSLELHKSTDITYSDVELKIRSDVSYVMRSYWGVMSDHLHSLMGGPWSGFCLDLMDSTQLNAEIIEEAVRYDASSGEFEFKHLGQNLDPSSLTLGSSPRKKYPLVVCMVRQDADEADPSGVGALITIIHIKDSECQVPTCILHQYLKQYSGQLTRLQALYTQGNTAGGSEGPPADERSSSSTEEDDDDDIASRASEEEDIPIEEACVVCQTNRITRALLPCRHVCVCSSCFGRLDTCPMCRARFLAYFLVAPEVEEPVDESAEPKEEESRSLWQRMYDALNLLALEP